MGNLKIKSRHSKNNHLLTDYEVAEILNLNVQTLRNWRNKGRGIPYIRLGAAIRYSLDDVIAELENRKVYPPND